MAAKVARMNSLTTRAIHLWQKRDTPEAKRLFRYTMVSVVSTVVAFGTLAIVFGVLHLAGPIESTVIANVVAVVPNYYLNRKWVWGKGGRSHLMKEIVPFWAMSAIGIVVSIFGAAIARHIGIEAPPQPLRADRGGPGGQHLVVRASSGSSSSSSSTACSKCTRSRSSTSWWKRPDRPRRPTGRRAGGPSQSRKLLNCSGMPKSSALHAAMTACRSSRFFPFTRN